MKRREHDLELDKNLNKTMVVQNPGGRGPGQPGFYCETCNRTYKDSTGYMDHINGRARMVYPHSFSWLTLIPFLLLLLDLRALGQTTRVERSTVEQVRARIAYLREKTKDASNAKAFDFDQRLAEIRAKELATREEKKNQKKALREQARIELAQQTATDLNGSDADMMNMMGFGGFGSTKK